jgi:hypothetical protein
MKKKLSKLSLNRETLKNLDAVNLAPVAGGATQATVCASACVDGSCLATTCGGSMCGGGTLCGGGGGSAYC